MHKHDAFQTIVFSDTILVFNKYDPKTQHEHEYLVMFACEFVQNLFRWSIDLEIQFRAILLYDEFRYQRLEHIEAYYGKALIDAYLNEKEIIGMGLFIDKRISDKNKVFHMIEFDNKFNYVFITQNLDNLKIYQAAECNIHPYHIFETDEFCCLKYEVKYLQILKEGIHSIKDSKIRAKYLQTYDLYNKFYGSIITKLENAKFDLRIINPKVDWTKVHWYLDPLRKV